MELDKRLINSDIQSNPGSLRDLGFAFDQALRSKAGNVELINCDVSPPPPDYLGRLHGRKDLKFEGFEDGVHENQTLTNDPRGWLGRRIERALTDAVLKVIVGESNIVVRVSTPGVNMPIGAPYFEIDLLLGSRNCPRSVCELKSVFGDAKPSYDKLNRQCRLTHRVLHPHWPDLDIFGVLINFQDLKFINTSSKSSPKHHLGNFSVVTFEDLIKILQDKSYRPFVTKEKAGSPLSMRFQINGLSLMRTLLERKTLPDEVWQVASRTIVGL